MIGKPYSGKLNVRFDEGKLEIGLPPLRQFSTPPYDPSCRDMKIAREQICRDAFCALIDKTSLDCVIIHL
jgi:hypothetical protein